MEKKVRYSICMNPDIHDKAVVHAATKSHSFSSLLESLLREDMAKENTVIVKHN